MKVAKRKLTRQIQTGSGHQILALGLFIMLLAFFIVLNALSTFDETTARPVMASLEKTFAPRIYKQDIGQASVEAVTKSNREGTSLEQISGIFTSRIPAIKIERQREGQLHVRVNTKDLLDSIQKMETISEYDEDKYLAYRDIFVAVLASQDTDYPLRMDVVLNLPQSPSDYKKGKRSLSNDRIVDIAKIASILQKQGLPIHLYSFSFKKGTKNKADIKFHAYEPYNFQGVLDKP